MKVKEERKCDICGELFVPRSSRQHYCRKRIVKVCPICGDEYTTICSSDMRTTCDKKECKKHAASLTQSAIKRKCKLCGEEFETYKIGQQYCGQLKSKTCPICGKEYTYICGPQYTQQTCGDADCQAQLIKERRTASALEQTRVCKWCGKEFHPKDWRDVYCYDQHYKTCVICGKQFEIDPRDGSDKAETCSKECMGKLMSQNHDYAKGIETQKANLMKKYGVDNPMRIPGSVDKIKKTTLERYGSEWYTQTDEYREKAKATNLERYGSEWYLGSKDSMEKRSSTNLKKYGVANPFQSEEIKKKIKETNLQKYGTANPAANPDIIKAVKERNIEKYGVEHPMMLTEYKQKAMQTNLEKYGRKAYTQQHISNIEQWYEFIDDPRSYIESHYQTPPRTKEIADDLGVGADTIDTYLGRTNSFDCVRRAKSLVEESLIAYIHNLDESIQVIHNSKSIIRPYEIDLYLPQFNFAIECDPTCTHNSSVPFRNYNEEPTPPSYHKMKTDMCEKVGIELFHIFGYDWANSEEIILSMIKNKLGRCSRTIYARKCKVVEVSGVDAIKFLNENHRQGSANSPVRLGLEYNGELVSLMTFGKMRGTIGTGNEDLSDCWELVRFCSVLDTSVVGGASKLLKHFVKEYNPARIRSFSDRAHTSGKLYRTLGFKEVRRSTAGYVWVDVVTDVAYHRANAQKQNLKKFLKDDSIDLSKTEREIMIEHGFVQVYDAGTITWEWIAEY